MTQRHWVQNEEVMLVTSVTKNRKPLLANPLHARIAVEGIYHIQERQPFFVYAFVIMPDHCYLLLSVPSNGAVSKLLYAYKRYVSFEICAGPVWQKRYHCRLIRDIIAAREYIHDNPVKAGMCQKQEDYLWSSASGKWDITRFDGMGCYES